MCRRYSLTAGSQELIRFSVMIIAFHITSVCLSIFFYPWLLPVFCLEPDEKEEQEGYDGKTWLLPASLRDSPDGRSTHHSMEFILGFIFFWWSFWWQGALQLNLFSGFCKNKKQRRCHYGRWVMIIFFLNLISKGKSRNQLYDIFNTLYSIYLYRCWHYIIIIVIIILFEHWNSWWTRLKLP